MCAVRKKSFINISCDIYNNLRIFPKIFIFSIRKFDQERNC